MRAACSQAPDMEKVLEIEKIILSDNADTLRYMDAKQSQLRVMRLLRVKSDQASSTQPEHKPDSTLDAFIIAGDTSAESWLKTLLQNKLSTAAYGRRLLMTGNKPPVALVDVGNTVCSCLGVKDSLIQDYLQTCSGDAAQRLSALQSALKCGTQCGSCVPELRRMIEPTLSPA